MVMFSYISRLNELSLEILELQRLKQDLVVCFKIVNTSVDIERNSFFTFSTDCITIGHTYKLLKQFDVRVDACKFRIANRVFTTWNNLPAMVVDSVNVNIFITRLNTASLSQSCVVF